MSGKYLADITVILRTCISVRTKGCEENAIFLDVEVIDAAVTLRYISFRVGYKRIL